MVKKRTLDTRPATKGDVKRLDRKLSDKITSEIGVLRSEFRSESKGLRFELLDKIDQSKEEMKSYIDKKIDIVLTHIDGFAGVYYYS